MTVVIILFSSIFSLKCSTTEKQTVNYQNEMPTIGFTHKISVFQGLIFMINLMILCLSHRSCQLLDNEYV